MLENDELQDSDFVEWVEKVRDPAAKASEGKRVLRAGKDAEASYEIAPLPDGRWALKVRYAFHSGDCNTASTPWCAFESRAACLAYFLEEARHHFRDDQLILHAQQKKAQQRMAALLDSILVFVEPAVEKPDPKEDERRQAAADRLQAQCVETTRKLKEQLPLFASLIDKEEG